MNDILLAPPIAFLLYLALGGLLLIAGRALAGQARPTPLKTSVYASGEAPDHGHAVPGYVRFFPIALFFAIVHLGVLVVGSGGSSPMVGAYLVGLLLVLIVLLLG
jgi:NADH:ubiquinone oxidoreductase subunit 3 (subunit A)